MARRRMIDPNIWNSEDVSRLTFVGRLLLIGMFSNADDAGRGRANPAYLRSIVFPYDDIPTKEIKAALDAIQEHICVQFYETDGQSYYAFTKWSKWQRVDKPSPSILPPPPNEYQISSYPRSDTDSANDSKNGSENDHKNEIDSANDSKNDSRPKEKKRKEDKEVVEDARACMREEPPFSATYDPEWKRVADCYLTNIGMLPGGKGDELLLSYFDDLGADVMIAAIEHTNLRNPDNPFRFLQKVLGEWAERGVKTKEQAAAAILDHDRRIESAKATRFSASQPPPPPNMRPLMDLLKEQQQRDKIPPAPPVLPALKAGDAV